MEEINRLLRLWRWSFPMLMKNWLEYKNGTRDGKRKLKKLEDILKIVLADDDIGTVMMHDVDKSISEAMLQLLVNNIRQELGGLQQDVPAFGKWSAEAEFEELEIPRAVSNVKSHAPLLYQLVHDLSENAWQVYDREEQNGRVVMIASILSVGRARNKANNFSRMLGLYLQGLGLKRRGLQVLHGLGVTDGYRSIDASKKTLSVRSEECS
jgi:hypothetical protein